MKSVTVFFDEAAKLVRKTGGKMSKEEMEEFELLAGGFSIDEKDNAEMDLRSVIWLAEASRDA